MREKAIVISLQPSAFQLNDQGVYTWQEGYLQMETAEMLSGMSEPCISALYSRFPNLNYLTYGTTTSFHHLEGKEEDACALIIQTLHKNGMVLNSLRIQTQAEQKSAPTYFFFTVV